MRRPVVLVLLVLVLVLVGACELPDAPAVGRTEICFRETIADEPGPREPHILDDAVVVDESERLLPREFECDVELKRLDVELALPNDERARVAVVERDANDEPVGPLLALEAGASVRLVVNAPHVFDSEVILEDEAGLIFSAGRRETQFTFVPSAYERSTSGPYRLSGCGSYDHLATRFFEGEDAVVVDSGETRERGGLAVTNVRSMRIDVDEDKHCTDIYDGDYTEFVIARSPQ